MNRSADTGEIQQEDYGLSVTTNYKANPTMNSRTCFRVWNGPAALSSGGSECETQQFAHDQRKTWGLLGINDITKLLVEA
jgi:hypothetical protein